jgi:hypothetical protein
MVRLPRLLLPLLFFLPGLGVQIYCDEALDNAVLSGMHLFEVESGLMCGRWIARLNLSLLSMFLYVVLYN